MKKLFYAIHSLTLLVLPLLGQQFQYPFLKEVIAQVLLLQERRVGPLQFTRLSRRRVGPVKKNPKNLFFIFSIICKIVLLNKKKIAKANYAFMYPKRSVLMSKF